MKISETVGVDVSKLSFDAVIYTQNKHQEFENSDQGFKHFINWLSKNINVKFEELFICLEHTGVYSLKISQFLSEKEMNYTVVPALQIKRSMGIVRGKSDKVDAKRIAHYAYLRKEELKQYRLPSKKLLEVKTLLTLRDKMVRDNAGYKAMLKEYTAMLSAKDYATALATIKKTIVDFTKKIKAIELKIKSLISMDQEMKKVYDLIISVKGIGAIVAYNLIVHTKCFTAFENSRQFACYAGIAPFPRSSGTSINGKERVNNLANKKMKSLLNTAALSFINHDKQMKAYYARRVQEGKSKMSTINIARNKLVHRVFAVVKRGTPYVELNNF